MHSTLAYLPTDIALALESDPALAAEAVKAFYEREPATLKVSLPAHPHRLVDILRLTLIPASTRSLATS